jgi:O-antigen/teichoic acid export membrane protein
MSVAAPAGPPSDDAALARGAGQVTLANLISGLSNLLLLVVLTRILPREDMAVVLFVYLFSEVVGVLGTLDLPAAMVYYVSRLPAAQARVVGLRTAGWLLRGSAVLALGLLALTPFAGDVFAQPRLGEVLPWLAFGLFADLPGQALPGFLLARRASGAYLRTTVLYTGLRFGGLVIPALLGAPVTEMIACFAVASWVRLADLAHRLYVVERGDSKPEGWAMRDLLRFSAPLVASTLVGKLGVQFDKYLLSVIAAPQAFAAYAVGAFELPLVSGVAYSVTNALMPELTRRHGTGDLVGARTLWHAAMVKVSAIMFPVFVFTVIMAEPMMRTLFSSAYADAAIPFRIIALLLPLRLCGYGAVSRSLGQSRPVLWGSLGAATVNLGLAWPLYALLGLAGPALATILGQMTAIATILWAIRRALDARPSELLPLRGLARTMAAAILAGFLPLGLLLGSGLPDAALLALGLALHLVVYVLIGRRIGALTEADLEYFKSILPAVRRRLRVRTTAR